MSKHPKNEFWALKSYVAFIKGSRGRLIFVGSIFAIGNILLAVIPLAIGALIGTLAEGKDPWFLVWVLIACSSLHAIVWNCAEFAYAKLIMPLSFQYETLMFKNIMRRPYHYFVDKFTGKVSSYITGISQEFRAFMSDTFFNYISQIVNIVSITLILGSINWQTGLIFVIGFILMIITGKFTLSKAMRMEQIETDVISTKNGGIIDSISNFTAIKSFHTELVEIKMIAAQQTKSFSAARRAFLWGAVFWGSMSVFIRHLIWPITIALNVSFYLNGQISIGQLATLLTTVLLFSTSIWEVVWHISQFGLKFARIEESHVYLFGKTIIDDTLGGDKTKPATTLGFRKLSMDHVSFAYPDKPDELVLRDISISIKQGEKIGIVGKSGSGKSTLTKLLLGYYPEIFTSVFIDGAPIDVQTLAKSIAFVPQDTSLFHRSIAENIAYASDENVSKDLVIAAAKKAQAHDFIVKMTDGYDALVGERGVKLSGGQRQRIAIARAMLKNSPILLLDEATSALDSESEKLIQEALDTLMKNRTSIVIAHRLSTIAKLDRIIVMDDGAIIEQGSHTELLAQRGTYAKLWAHQSGGFIEE